MPPDRTPLQPFIAPASIAVFGASPTPGKFGHGLVRNLREGGFRGRLHLISDRHREIDGLACHASIAEVGETVTLALIATPPESVADIVESCARAGVRGAVVYSAGLRDNDPAGAAGLQRLQQTTSRQRLRLLGPGALGYVLPHAGLNLTPLIQPIPAGNLALVSQSASVCTNILDWNHNDEFGFSAIFMPGASRDIELPEILDYLACDLATASILLYLEGLHDTRRFLSAVRAAASVKPVIALKAGHRPMSARIAEAHCGAPVDRDDAFDAALRRAGVLRVRSVGDMFSAARALTTPRKPHGNRLAIVANGGGPTVMAADHAAELGIELAELSPATRHRLDAMLPNRWSAGNPVDLRFDAGPERFVEGIVACIDDPGVDGVLAILSPNTYVDPLAVAQATIAAISDAQKPVLACWLGERSVAGARAAFTRARFPVFRTAENAVVAFAFMANWVRNQELLQETPPAQSSYLPADLEAARRVIEQALAEDRRCLRLTEAKAVLGAFHIPVSPTREVTSPTEAVAVANLLGYPVAIKVTGAAHATRGGVRHHLRSPAEVALAFREVSDFAGGHSAVYIEPDVDKRLGRELTVGIHADRVFGPVITLAQAGIAAEIYDARSIALPPLNPRLVGEMIGVPHVARLLGPLGEAPAVDVAALREILLRVSELASELPWVRSLDIASLVADAHGATAVDVSIEIRPLPAVFDRYGHMAIYPYPSQWVGEFTLRDGSRCAIRPIRPEDATLLQDFVRHLSPRSKRFRFFSATSELPRRQLARYTQIDYGRELTLVVTSGDAPPVMLGEAHYASMPDGKNCEFAVVIADEMAGKGLGRLLMNRLMEAAKAQGLSTIRGQVMADNEAMLGLMEALDFVVALTDEEGVVEVTHAL